MDLDAEFTRIRNRLNNLEKPGAPAAPAGMAAHVVEARFKALTTVLETRLKALEARIAACEKPASAPNPAPPSQPPSPATPPTQPA